MENIDKVLQALGTFKNEIAQVLGITVEKVSEYYPILKRQAIIYDVTKIIQYILFILIVILLVFTMFIGTDTDIRQNEFLCKVLKILIIILVTFIIFIIISFIYGALHTFEYRMILKLLR